MAATLASISSCPCLVERAMMPPSITSDAYHFSQVPQTEPLEPVIEFRQSSLLSVKDDLHDDIMRIFSKASRPSLPPFTLPFGSIWDSPSVIASSAASHSFGSDGNRTTGSSGTSFSSRGSSFRNESFGSLIFSPSVTNTPTHSVDHRLFSAFDHTSSDSTSSAGLGLTGLYNTDGTPFDGYGVLQPLMSAKEDGQAPHPLFYTHSGYGLGLYGESQNPWQWEGEGSVLFDADGDTTLVDYRGSSHPRHGSRSVDFSRRQNSFSPPGLAKDIFSPDLERLFSNLSGYSSKSTIYATCVPHKTSHSTRFRSTITTTAPYDSAASQQTSTYAGLTRKMHRTAPHTAPLPPTTPDVFYTSSSPSSLTSISRRLRFKASQRFQLNKDSGDAASWKLPPISLQTKKAKI